MTAEKFLNRLPKFVIRQGEVIDIRGPIRDTLKVRPALAPPALLAGVGGGGEAGFTINPGPAYQSSGLSGGSGLRAPEDGLDGEMSSSELFPCLLETMELVSSQDCLLVSQSWDQRAAGQRRSVAVRVGKSGESKLGVSPSSGHPLPKYTFLAFTGLILLSPHSLSCYSSLVSTCERYQTRFPELCLHHTWPSPVRSVCPQNCSRIHLFSPFPLPTILA